MESLAKWLLELAKKVFVALWDFVTDILLDILDAFLSVIATAVAAIPAPSFISSGLQGAINAIPSDVWFFASHFRLGECLALFGAAVAFRLARKAITLFQW